MAILIISANALFIEAISETLTARLGVDPISTSPGQAEALTTETHPDVILVDEAIPPGLLKKILKQAQELRSTRLILLNSTCNDFIVLDAYRSVIGSIDDLVNSIRPEATTPERKNPYPRPGR
jgi:DNA-binding NarL/FixJ family response regulator